MLESITNTLKSASMGPAAVPLALLLGLVSAVASACCTLPAMGMLVAYSGIRVVAGVLLVGAGFDLLAQF